MGIEGHRSGPLTRTLPAGRRARNLLSLSLASLSRLSLSRLLSPSGHKHRTSTTLQTSHNSRCRGPSIPKHDKPKQTQDTTLPDAQAPGVPLLGPYTYLRNSCAVVTLVVTRAAAAPRPLHPQPPRTNHSPPTPRLLNPKN